MTRTVYLHIDKEDMKFSAGHFTIFSADERERLHGHNFKVSAKLAGVAGEDGMLGDYNIFKTKLREICQNLDEYMLLPEKSPFLQIEEDENYYYALFAGDKMPFIKKDVLCLPVTNITIESLAAYCLSLFVADKACLEKYHIHQVQLGVSSGPGQTAYAEWRDA